MPLTNDATEFQKKKDFYRTPVQTLEMRLGKRINCKNKQPKREKIELDKQNCGFLYHKEVARQKEEPRVKKCFCSEMNCQETFQKICQNKSLVEKMAQDCFCI
ncbi:hypothetical protein CEXT_209391 [Caerostris extrusa]|uniref:Uncharacterized protein n=1 Tax=Caerostris extrusa TaxID=172846 RepID=A0AAV4M2F3_CAEEX|nr:hypothetical protein CEXT_209391 [Caerostris extrusa]